MLFDDDNDDHSNQPTKQPMQKYQCNETLHKIKCTLLYFSHSIIFSASCNNTTTMNTPIYESDNEKRRSKERVHNGKGSVAIFR